MTEWRTIADYPNYQVSDDGRIRRSRPSRRLGYQRELTLVRQTNGYLMIGLWRDAVPRIHLVHILVAEAFLGPRPSTEHQVAHNDGTRDNNVVSNLRWATRAENQADRKLHGTDLPGERHPVAKLTTSDVRTIRTMLAARVPHRAIAANFAVSPSTISAISTGQNWSNVE